MSRCTTPRACAYSSALGDLPPDVRGLRRTQAPVGVEHAAQAAAGEQLEHHERDVVLAPVVDRHHVGVVERRRHLGLGPEPAQEPGVLGQREVQDLHPDPALEADVVGDVDATARACTDRCEQAVATGEDTAGEIGDAGDRHRVTVPAAPRRSAAPATTLARWSRTRRRADVSLGVDGRLPPPSAAAAPTRRRLFKHPGRVAIVAITLLVGAQPRHPPAQRVRQHAERTKALPADIEAVSPAPNELTGLIDDVTRRPRRQYTGVLVIDGVEIPEDQLDRVVGIQSVTLPARPRQGHQPLPRRRERGGREVLERPAAGPARRSRSPTAGSSAPAPDLRSPRAPPRRAPRRWRSRATHRWRRRAGTRSYATRRPATAARSMNSCASARVMLATERSVRSCQNRS